MAPIAKGAPSAKKRTSGISLERVKGENFYRDAKKVARLKMLNGGKPIRDKTGKIVQAAAFQKGEDETQPGRVQPDRRWFGSHSILKGYSPPVLSDHAQAILELFPRQRSTTSGQV